MNIVITPEELENIIESYVVSKFSMEVTGIGPKDERGNTWVEVDPDKPTPKQIKDHERRREMGFKVFVCDDIEQGQMIIDGMVEGAL
jgi:hypothetical protein